VSLSDQTDFPVLISGTFPYLASVASGGHVQNTNGYDIVFTSDAAGQNKLDHEIDNYNPLTRIASFWVRLPLLSHTADTQIYMWYGNSAVVVSQENKVGNNGVAAATGKIGVGGSTYFNNYFLIPSDISFEPGTAVTLETWLNPTIYYAGGGTDFQNSASISNCSSSCPYALGLDQALPQFSIDGGRGTNSAGGSSLPQGQWSHLAGTFDGNNVVMYKNGVPSGSQALAGSINYATNTGATNNLYLAANMWGLIDEVRISTVSRSADWIATEYNKQSIPDEFLYICPEQNYTLSPAPCVLNQISSPNITGVLPTSGAVGSTLTITGRAFGSSQSDSTLLLNGGALNVISWSNTQVVAIVQESATSSASIMQVDVWQSNTDQTFTVTPPRLDAITPSIGGVGDVVLVKRLGFHSSQANSTLTFNGVYSPISSWSNSSITAIVPGGVTTGSVQVLVGGLTSNALPFTLSGSIFKVFPRLRENLEPSLRFQETDLA
jgi:hypothetical protein